MTRLLLSWRDGEMDINQTCQTNIHLQHVMNTMMKKANDALRARRNVTSVGEVPQRKECVRK